MSRKRTFDPFFEIISCLDAPQEVELFLRDLCTPAELESLADRWTAVLELKQEKPYRKIHEETGVSVTTVGRVARALSYGSGGYELAYDKLKGIPNEK